MAEAVAPTGAVIAHTPGRPAEELGLSGIAALAAGYQRAQVLFAAAELDVFGILAAGPKSAEEVAAILDAPLRGVRLLLDACVALKLLKAGDRGYENSRSARLFLAGRGEFSFRPTLRFWQTFSYGVWGRLSEAVRHNQPQLATGPKPADLFAQMATDPSETRVFFEGLAGLAYWPARRLAELIDLSAFHHVIDVGGGTGVYSEALLKRNPHLRVTLFDEAPVCALARERLAGRSFDGRVQVIEGDFHRGPLPEDADCALVSNVLHDWQPSECLRLLREIRAVLPPGGQIIVHDFAPGEGEQTAEATLFSLALLLDTCGGQVYRADEMATWLREAGFDRIRHVPITTETSAIVGLVKPA